MAPSVNYKPVTLNDVAQLAGVSRSTVSRAFTPGASVGRRARAKILAACEELGYRPNVIARTLVTRQSRMIAIVVSYLENQFYPLFIELSSQLLQQQGYHVLLFVSGNPDRPEQDGAGGDVDELLLELLQYQVDGIILASVPLSSRLAQQCYATGIPVVLFNRIALVSPGIYSVSSDNVYGGRIAARLLVDSGYERIAFIAGAEDSSTNRDREKGFREELERLGRPLFARGIGHYDFALAAQATRDLFNAREVPDAIFVANDHMAFAVLDTLRLELGMSVPDDVGIVGFDDVPQAAWGGYRLTTIAQDFHRMTKQAIAILMAHISNEEVDVVQTVNPVELVLRATTPPNRKRKS